MKSVKILIVDDHLAIIEGYKSIISNNNFGYTPIFFQAKNCQEAAEMIENESKIFDVFLVDISIPADATRGLFSGEDIASLIRKKSRHSKILVLTSYFEGLKLYRIKSTIKPEGILIKSDFSPQELVLAISEVLEGRHVYSKTVLRQITEITEKATFLDDYNRKIISLLNDGIKTKNLPKFLNLSLSAVDKRKASIKEYFGIIRGDDEDILSEARKKGLI